jgi:hypothetical protein
MRGVLALLVERAQALRESADGEMAACHSSTWM